MELFALSLILILPFLLGLFIVSIFESIDLKRPAKTVKRKEVEVVFDFYTR